MRLHTLSFCRTIFVCLTIAITGCKKEATPVTAIKPELPVPTCDDHSDDGRFEAWNETERDLLVPSGSVVKMIFPDTPSTAQVQWISITSHNLSVRNPAVTIRIKGDYPSNYNQSLILVDRDTKRLTGLNMIRSGTSGDTIDYALSFSMLDSAQTFGCKRLYYHFIKVAPVGTPNYNPGYTNFVFNKGHFDVEVRP